MDKPDETTVEMAKHFAMGNSNRIELIESGRKYLRYLIRQQRTHQIPNQPLHCGIETWLKFNSRGGNKGQFTWCCANSPSCKREYLYKPIYDEFYFYGDTSKITKLLEAISKIV